MINSARLNVPVPIPPVAITIFSGILLFCAILKNGTDDICENIDHYMPGWWVGRVDQFQALD